MKTEALKRDQKVFMRDQSVFRIRYSVSFQVVSLIVEVLDSENGKGPDKLLHRSNLHP